MNPSPSPSRWPLMGAAFVLAVVVVAVTALSLGRNESALSLLLAEKGSSLIRALEGSVRMGMRGAGGGVRLQTLLEELRGTDVLFIAVTMPDGTIIAHSNPERLGEILELHGLETDESTIRQLQQTAVHGDVRADALSMEGHHAFVVYRELLPLRGGQRHKSPLPLIFLGLDMTPFEKMRQHNRLNLSLFAGGILLLGMASLLALYYAQRARESRRRQKLAEGQVRVLEEEVRRKEKLAAIGNLAAGVAHEIRNPLSSLKGYATYFGQRFVEGSPDREAAHSMVREVERLNRVISDLIGLSRPTDVRTRPEDIIAVVQDVIRLLHHDAEIANVRMQCVAPIAPVAPAALPHVLLDADRFRQALLNLCLNALEAMPTGGDVTLRLSQETKDSVLLTVEDIGTGILPEHIAHIFDPYFTTKGQGTGFGLAMVQKILEAHGGSVHVQSRHISAGTPSGTVFYLRIPVAKEGVV